MAVVIAAFMVSLIAGPQVAKGQTVGSGAIDSGLVGYWRLDENTSTTALDSSGYGNTATISNGNWFTGHYGGATYLSGSSSKIDCGNVAILNMSGSVSVGLWYYWNASTTAYSRLLAKGNGATYALLMDATGSKPYSSYTTSTGGESTAPNMTLTTGWHFILSTFNVTGVGNSLVLYVDNVVSSSAYYGGGGALVNEPLSLTIGSNQQYNPAIGGYDSVRIYSRALNSTEENVLYNGFYLSTSTDAGSIVFPVGLVNVGVDQSRSFYVSAQTGFVPWAVYLDGAIFNTQPIVTLSGVESNHTLYFQSQYVGSPVVTPSSNETSVSSSANSIDINIYYFLVAFLVGAGVVSVLVFPWLGLFSGSVGVVLTGLFLNAGNLTMNTYLSASDQIVRYTIPLGLYVWIPIILIIFNFLAPLVSKK